MAVDLFLAGNGEKMRIYLFLAGDYQFPYKNSNTDVYLMGYNRLLSYDYQKKLVDKFIERKKQLELFLGGTDKFGEEERRQALDIYLAGAYAETKETMDQVMPSNILFSYENLQIKDPKGLDIYHMFGSNLFIDSGAYSMWTRGVGVDVDEYIKWINERSDYIDLFGQIDAIPGTKDGGATQKEVREAAEKTWKNYLYMRQRVNKPESLLYTFHVGEPKEFLMQALEWNDKKGKHIPYIALGGMVGKSHDIRKNFLNMCFNVIRKSSNPKVKVHAFGMTSKDLLAQFPITSADSTSWIMTAANGGIMTDLGTIVVSENQSHLPGYFGHLPEDMRTTFKKHATEFGFTIEQLATERNCRIVHNARYMKDRVSKIKQKVTLKRTLF